MEVSFTKTWNIFISVLFLHFEENRVIMLDSEEFGNLTCHKCEDTFVNRRWDPYTECQILPNSTPLVPCLKSETYCMVERISIYGMTTSIKRECSSECYYGCRAKNFGVTTWSCTSCCQSHGCNTGNDANANQSKKSLILLCITFSIFPFPLLNFVVGSTYI